MNVLFEREVQYHKQKSHEYYDYGFYTVWGSKNYNFYARKVLCDELLSYPFLYKGYDKYNRRICFG